MKLDNIVLIFSLLLISRLKYFFLIHQISNIFGVVEFRKQITVGSMRKSCKFWQYYLVVTNNVAFLEYDLPI